MNETRDKAQSQPIQVEYTPPSRDTLYRFARKVCEVRGDSTPEMAQGLTDFLIISARIKAKQMSMKGGQNGKQ